MADDWRKLIQKLDLLTLLEPPPFLRYGWLPNETQRCRNWLMQYGNDPTVSDEAKQVYIDYLEREIREREHANPAATVEPQQADPPSPTVKSPRFRRAPTTVESQQVAPPPSPMSVEPPTTVGPRSPPLRQWALHLIHNKLCELFPPNGAPPEGFGADRLCNAINKRLRDGGSEEKISPSSVRNYLTLRRNQLAIASRSPHKT